VTVVWYRAAQEDLLALPHWRIAEQVAAAVRTYAESEVGFVRRVVHDEVPDEWRLYVGAFYVRVRVVTDTLHVERILRWRAVD
jgi:hypothetical protein